MAVKHTKVATVADDGTSEVGTNEWNDDHTIDGDVEFNSHNITGVSYQDIERIAAPADPATNNGRIYIKQVDANNDGIFIKIKKSGVFTEVQIG
jgi:glucose dehydrogenase